MKINYDDELTCILNEKNHANNLLKEGKLSESYSIYLKLRERIENLQEKKEDEKFLEILVQLKFILSNLAMVCYKEKNYTESVKYDRRVIAMDKLFHKSYARLIDSYLTLNNFTLARYFYSLMKNIFSEEIMTLYENILNKIKKEIEEKDSYINNLKNIFSV